MATKSQEIVQSISAAETRILQVLWDESPLAADAIVSRLNSDGSSHPKTVKTLLNRLLKKQAIGFEERSRKYHYFPLLKEEQFYGLMTDSFLDRFFNGQLSPLISSFSERTKLSKEDIRELKNLITKMEADDD